MTDTGPPRVMDPDEVDDIAIDLANGTVTPGLRYDDLVATVVAANQACAHLAAAIVESWSDDLAAQSVLATGEADGYMAESAVLRIRVDHDGDLPDVSGRVVIVRRSADR